jgi:protein TonB
MDADAMPRKGVNGTGFGLVVSVTQQGISGASISLFKRRSMSPHRRLGAAMCSAATLIFAACGTQPVDKHPAPVADRHPAQVARVEPAKPPFIDSSSALTVNQYHKDFARHLTRVNQNRIYEGAPPNPLRAIVVLEVELARDGQVTDVRSLRVPSHGQEQFKLARESVLRAAPYPRPAMTVALGKSRIALTETWLFNSEGRFQLRSLALPQQNE